MAPARRPQTAQREVAPLLLLLPPEFPTFFSRLLGTVGRLGSMQAAQRAEDDNAVPPCPPTHPMQQSSATLPSPPLTAIHHEEAAMAPTLSSHKLQLDVGQAGNHDHRQPLLVRHRAICRRPARPAGCCRRRRCCTYRAC